MYINKQILQIIRDNVNTDLLLKKLDLKIERKTSTYYWLKSPTKNEKNPSFHIRISDGLWNDFSADTGGGPVELVKNLLNIDAYSAGRWLVKNKISFYSDTKKIQKIRREKKNKWEILQIINVENVKGKLLYNIHSYRKLNISLLNKMGIKVFKIRHIESKKIIWCFGCKNISNGYEFFDGRPNGFKAASGKKDISVFKIKSLLNKRKLVITESILDAAAYFSIHPDCYSAISLNGIAQIKNAVNYLSKFEEVLYNIFIEIALDNDLAGQMATCDLKKILLKSGLLKNALSEFQYSSSSTKDIVEVLLLRKLSKSK
jgi:hypothetical protein